MALCLSVVSGKGGTGKSTASAGLGLALAAAGKKVLLIDMDEGLRCLDMMLGVDGDVIFDLGDILEGKDITDAVYCSPYYNNLNLIPASSRLSRINSQAFYELIKRISVLYDVIILDFPAGLDFDLLNGLDKKTEFITVCNPDPVSVRDAAVVCGRLLSHGIKARLIINKFDIELIKNRTYRNIDDIIDSSGLQLLGILPECNELKLLPITHRLKKRGKAINAFSRIAGRLCGKEIRLPSLKKI